VWGWLGFGKGRRRGRGGRGRGVRRRMRRRCRRFAFQLPFPVREVGDEKVQRIYELLPKRDCGACGYDSCYECAMAIARGEAPPDACRIVGKRIAPKIEEILGR